MQYRSYMIAHDNWYRHSREGGNPVCRQRHGKHRLERHAGDGKSLQPLVCTSQNWVLDCRLRGNDGLRPRCPLFLRVSA